MVEQSIRSAWPDIGVQVKIITTRGDETGRAQAEPADRKAGRKGLFTNEIERALLNNEIDVAVHSAKDLPSEQHADLVIAATLPRAAVEDVLVTRTSGTIASLPEHATVATGSIRRAFQLRALRPDLNIADLRGNVPTRLRKLGASNWDGIILACAGLERLGFNVAIGGFPFEGHSYGCELLSSHDFLSAGGQGIIAMQVRSGDRATTQFLEAVSDPQTLLCLRAEREFLRLLNGDCDSPVGVLAAIGDGSMRMSAQVFKPPALAPLAGGVEVSAANANIEGLAVKLMEQIDRG